MKILFLGDIRLDRKAGQHSISDEIYELFEECDYICINLEGPLCDGIKPASKKGPNLSNCADEIMRLFGNLPVIYNMANNHIMDYGKSGLKVTIETLGNRPRVGADLNAPYKPCILDGNDVKVALVSICEGGFGVAKDETKAGYAWMMNRRLPDMITDLKRTCDHVIIVSHAGLEEVNIPLPEIRFRYYDFLKSGGSAVVAHHPHVIQGKEKFENKDIFYSLGNAMFDGMPEITESIGIILDIETDSILSKVIPLDYQNGVLGIDHTGMAEKMFLDSGRLISSEEYERLIDETCVNAYERYYRDYYKLLYGRPGRIRHAVKSILNIFSGNLFDEELLYHNLEIETHYWAVCRALDVLRRN